MEEKRLETERVKLTEEDLTEKKYMLMSAKLNKDDTDIQLEEYEDQIAEQLPIKLLDDSIKELEDDIKKKIVHRRGQDGIETEKAASEGDICLMKIKLKSLKKMKKADIPMRDLRFRMLQLRESKNRIDAPEQQIKKLEKEIREGYATVPKRPQQMPTGIQ